MGERIQARFGGLAVALGIGAAMAAGHGVAVAEPSDESTSSSESSEHETEHETEPAESEPDTDDHDEEPSEPAVDEEDSEAEEPAEVDEDERDSAAEPTRRSDDEGVEREEPEPTVEVREVEAEPVEPEPEVRSVTVSVIREVTVVPEVPVIPETEVLQPPTPIRAEPPTALVFGLAPARAPQPVPPRPAPWLPVIQLLVGLVRRIDHTFFNDSPTARPVVDPQLSTGVITGTLGARDRDGDPLTYRIVEQPDNGTVVIAADGTFTYTPDEQWAHETAGADEFTVVVDDAGRWPHLHLFSPRGHATKVTVQLDVDPVNDPPIIDAAATGNADGTTTFTVMTSDSDSDTVTVTPSATHYGELTDNQDGTYTYTPDVNRTSSTVTETITFTADDGHGGIDTTAATVDIEPGQEVVAVVHMGDNTLRIFTNPDGTRSYVGIRAGEVKIIDMSDPDNPEVIKVDVPGAVDSMAAGDDGSLVWVAGRGTVTVIDTSDLDDIKTADFNIPSSGEVAVSADGTRAWVSTSQSDRAVYLIDASAGIDNAVVTRIPINDWSYDIATTADGSVAWVRNSQEVLYRIDATDPTNPVITSVTAPEWIVDVAVADDGSRVYALGYGSNLFIVGQADTATPELVTVNTGGRSSDMAVSADGTHAYLANGRLTIIDASDVDDVVVTAVPVSGSPTAVGVSADGTRAYVGSGNDTVTIVDLTTNAVVTTLPLGGTPTRLAVAADGGTAFTSNTFDSSVSVVRDYSV